MSYHPTLSFLPPAHQLAERQKNRWPDDLQHILLFADPILYNWGTQQQCQLSQQIYKTEVLELSLINIKVTGHNLLTVECASPFGALLYALEGYHFLYIEPHGIIPLFTPTYTLQFIAEGQHRMLVSNGSCTLLYIKTDEILQQLRSKYEMHSLNYYIKPTPKARVLRLPIDNTIMELIQQLPKLPAHPDAFSIPSIASRLLLHIPYQQQSTNFKESDLPACIMAFIARNIQLPVSELMHKIQQEFNLSNSAVIQFLSHLNL